LKMRNFQASDVKSHFDRIAPGYDHWKKKNHYYHSLLKEFYRKNIPEGSRVLELGTGTGEILASCRPGRGVGLDISEKMLELARTKFPAYEFYAADAGDFILKEKFDYVIMSDLLEHLPDIPKAINCVYNALLPGGEFICTAMNPFYGPVIALLEKLKVKMPEGPHAYISSKNVEQACRRRGFEFTARESLIFFPARVTLFSAFFNKIMPELPFLNKLCCLQVLKAKIHTADTDYGNKRKF